MRWGSMIFDTTWLDIAARGIILAAAAILWVVVLVRINGLRSLSKMTNFDFVMTVALGSLVAGAAQASDWKAFAQAMVAMAGLFLVQFLAARIRLLEHLLKTRRAQRRRGPKPIELPGYDNR